MSRIKKLFFLSAFWCCSLHAFWDPYALERQGADSGTLLNNPGYLALKAQAAETLRGSWCSAEKAELLMDLILLTRPTTCVEIGAFTGSSVLPVALALKYSNAGVIFAIDAWDNQEAVKYLADDDPNKAWWSTVNMAIAHDTFKRLIKDWQLQDVCIEVHEPSHKAVFSLPIEIDFLHIDGDYSEVVSLRDVESYLPMVKVGGYVLLSNLFFMANGNQPKLQAFLALCEVCEIVGSVDGDNAVLFKKIKGCKPDPR